MKSLLLGLLLLGVSPALAQDADTAYPADPADVASIDSLITALYATISGPQGEPRQWDRFYSLVHPEARLMPTRCPADGACTVQVLTPQEYRAMAEPFLVREGFHEYELARTTERFGHVAHAFSSYESFRRGESEPFARGINSIQLFWDGTRWWVMSILWDSERPDNPLPADMTGE